jgi:hypothetical protein
MGVDSDGLALRSCEAALAQLLKVYLTVQRRVAYSETVNTRDAVNRIKTDVLGSETHVWATRTTRTGAGPT